MASGEASARHGGNLAAAARELGQAPAALLDASASLVPFGPGWRLRLEVTAAVLGWPLRAYPDRELCRLRQTIAAHHGLDPAWVLPGNGAAELFTWAARDAAAAGVSLLPAPGFADYPRALACWGGAWRLWPLPLHWGDAIPQPFPLSDPVGDGTVLWLTNPHNPTGQLWSRASLEPLLERFALVICDEAFLPLTPPGLGEPQSLIPLLERHPNLVVIRSLTKLHAIAGLRLGYALAHPDRLRCWAGWRDPWPVNALAAAAGEALLREPRRARRWQQRAGRWVAQEGAWLRQALAATPGIEPMPSATNFLLVRGCRSPGTPQALAPVGEALQRRHGILLRDCRSFAGLDGSWLRIGLQHRAANLRIVAALRQELSAAVAPGPPDR
jgi:histidinol-phosphate/aromatic aminotransferase/cobyric acid decarboxylase-like protein